MYFNIQNCLIRADKTKKYIGYIIWFPTGKNSVRPLSGLKMFGKESMGKKSHYWRFTPSMSQLFNFHLQKGRELAALQFLIKSIYLTFFLGMERRSHWSHSLNLGPPHASQKGMGIFFWNRVNYHIFPIIYIYIFFLNNI